MVFVLIVIDGLQIYKKKSQAQWNEDIMMLAIADCNAGIPVKTTARKYGLPYATLYRHWKKGSSNAQLGRFRKVFNDQQEVLEYASQNNVVILSLPPHTSNKLQPLDVAVYGALKIYFEQEINRFQKTHPGRIVNQYDVARLFAPAYLKCATPNNAIKGFQSTGIWPINMDVWEEKDFAPCSTTLTERNGANSEATLQETTNRDVGTLLTMMSDLRRQDSKVHLD
ncbi:unnamed protein product, partial [Brenthis ino]